VELAIATNTAPAQWINETDAILATAIAVLSEQAERVKK
jgi:hypothetical protein